MIVFGCCIALVGFVFLATRYLYRNFEGGKIPFVKVVAWPALLVWFGVMCIVVGTLPH